MYRLQAVQLGVPHTGAREYDADEGRDEEVHVVHRTVIYNEKHGRSRPASPGVCVSTWPGGALVTSAIWGDCEILRVSQIGGPSVRVTT